MVAMHEARRIEIMIEAVMERRLTQVLTEAGVTGFTVLPVSGGFGRSGEWTREGQVSRGGGMVCVVCIVLPDRVERALEAFFPLLDRHIGLVNVMPTMVVRQERF